MISLRRIRNFWQKVRSVVHYKPSILQITNHVKYLLSSKNTVLNYRPLWLLIYVSDLCNLKCKMCPHHTPGDASDFEFMKQMYGFMSAEMFTQIVKRFPEATLVMLAWIGEPLLNPDFTKIIRIAKEHKKMINLVTNGVLLSPKMIEEIIENNYFKKISISLNAPNPSEYNKICNVSEKLFETVLQNIRNLALAKKKHNLKMEIAVSAVCSSEFMSMVTEFLTTVEPLWADQIELHNYIDFSIVEKKGIQWTPIEKEKVDPKTYEKIKEAASRLRSRVVLPVVKSQKKFTKKCDWYFKNLAFDSNGDMWSCGRVMNPNSSYGNIGDSDDIWNNTYMREMREKFISSTKLLPSCCYKCVENHGDDK